MDTVIANKVHTSEAKQGEFIGIVICPDGTGSYMVGEITGGYVFARASICRTGERSGG